MPSFSRTTIVPVTVAVLCLALAACSSGSPKVQPPIPSDPASLAEASFFARQVHSASPDFCKAADVRRNITTNPKYHYPPIGAQSRCVAWGQQLDLFAFTSPAYRDQYMQARTAQTCAVAPKLRAGFVGFHWVVRPKSVTLAPTYDVARLLSVLLPGTIQFTNCTPGPAPTFIGGSTELDAISSVLHKGGVGCGPVVVRPKDPIYQSSFSTDTKNRVIAVMPAGCSKNPAIQLVGISPLSAEPTTTPIPQVLRYYCKLDPSLHVIHGLTWIVLTKDAALADKLAPVLTKPSVPVCQAT